MIDKEKCLRLYQELKSLQYDDLIQIVAESESKEEKEFFVTVGNFVIQQRQKLAIERNEF